MSAYTATQTKVCEKEVLAIVLTEDEKTKQTDIFYARADLTEAATPSP